MKQLIFILTFGLVLTACVGMNMRDDMMMGNIMKDGIKKDEMSSQMMESGEGVTMTDNMASDMMQSGDKKTMKKKQMQSGMSDHVEM